MESWRRQATSSGNARMGPLLLPRPLSAPHPYASGRAEGACHGEGRIPQYDGAGDDHSGGCAGEPPEMPPGNVVPGSFRLPPALDLGNREGPQGLQPLPSPLPPSPVAPSPVPPGSAAARYGSLLQRLGIATVYSVTPTGSTGIPTLPAADSAPEAGPAYSTAAAPSGCSLLSAPTEVIPSNTAADHPTASAPLAPVPCSTVAGDPLVTSKVPGVRGSGEHDVLPPPPPFPPPHEVLPPPPPFPPSLVAVPLPPGSTAKTPRSSDSKKRRVDIVPPASMLELVALGESPSVSLCKALVLSGWSENRIPVAAACRPFVPHLLSSSSIVALLRLNPPFSPQGPTASASTFSISPCHR